jgi:D-alanyl-D-alanine carboxypeptidase
MHSNPKLSRTLASYFNQSPITALVVCIRDSKDNRFDYTYGHINNTLKTNVSSDHLFGVGSITKTFVAAALMQLQEKGLLHIREPIGNYIPDYPRWKDIPVCALLNMTGGIANYTDLPLFNNLIENNSREVITPKTLIDSAYQADDLCAPLSEWHYSNTNYLLLGLILQAVSQDSIENIRCEPWRGEAEGE